MINKHIVKIVRVLAVALISVSCGGGGDDPDPPANPPTSATLQEPSNNEVCLVGVSVSSTQSEVAFSWDAGQHTDSYDIIVKNLNTNQSSTYNSGTTNKTITLSKGEPYSWYVISKSTGTSQTAQSDTWKFYLAGDGVISYAPFPAGIIYPVPGSTISGTSVSLQWQGSDVDDDITSYEIFLDAANAVTSIGNTNVEKLDQVTISSGTIYYWKVVTTDSKANTSDSGVFTFKVK